MKKATLYIIALCTFAACSTGQPQSTEDAAAKAETVEQADYSSFGATITQEGAVASADLMQHLAGKDSAYIKVTGEINKVCQAKGCWMTMQAGDSDMRITFKDYGFFVPKDASGKQTVIEGVIKQQTTDVETLRHYATDAGKSEEEIAAITEPVVEYAFEAVGVIISDQPL